MGQLPSDCHLLWVVHPSSGLAHWQAELLTRLQRVAGLTLCQVSVADLPPSTEESVWVRLIHILDRALFSGADTATARVPTADLPASLFAESYQSDTLQSVSIQTEATHHALNFTNLTDAVIANAIGAPTLGLSAGAHSVCNPSMIGLWECLESRPITHISTDITDPQTQQTESLWQATECTDPVSIGRTRNAACWAGAELLYRAISHWASDGPARATPANDAEPTPRSVGPWTALVTAPVHIARGIFRKLKRRSLLRQWIVLGRTGTEPDNQLDFKRWQQLLPPRDVFWADPFPVTRNGKHYVFIEEATFTPRRGHLAVLELQADGTPGAATTILKKPYHLSYPNVFEHQGDWYMMPESGEDRSLQIYRCDSWPDTWTFQHNALEDLAVFDGTLLEHNGRWWLFATVQQFDASSPNVFLHLWHSDSPFGPWTAHVANPISTDVRSARPAGQFFTRDGVLYRPSQNCGTHYGFGLQINRVDRLDESGYAETCVESHEPWDGSIDAVHTLNSAEGVQVADAVYWRPPER